MNNRNRRRFTRINIQWAVHLDFGLTEYKDHLDNISLSGFHVDGIFNQSIGDLCLIKVKESGLYVNTALAGVGSISRIDHVGIAVEFHSMKLDSFYFLQTSLVNRGVNPSVLGNEFFGNKIFDFDDDIIFFRPYRFGLKQLKIP